MVLYHEYENCFLSGSLKIKVLWSL